MTTKKLSSSSEQAMLAMHLQGKSYKAIGKAYSVSGEWARLTIIRIKPVDAIGGDALRARLMRHDIDQKRELARDAKTLKGYGCTYSEAILLNGGEKISSKSGLASKYKRQKLQAKHRNVEFKLTFPIWLSLWRDSGMLDKRGRGQGCCMARKGDIGAYEVGNVYFCTIGQNFSDSYARHSSSFRKQKAALRKMAALGQSLGVAE